MPNQTASLLLMLLNPHTFQQSLILKHNKKGLLLILHKPLQVKFFLFLEVLLKELPLVPLLPFQYIFLVI